MGKLSQRRSVFSPAVLCISLFLQLGLFFGTGPESRFHLVGNSNPGKLSDAHVPSWGWSAPGFRVPRIIGIYRGYIGIMEKKMETTIMGLYRDYIGYVLGMYRGSIGIMEKKMESIIMGLCRDYIWYVLGMYRGYIGIMEKKMETTV